MIFKISAKKKMKHKMIAASTEERTIVCTKERVFISMRNYFYGIYFYGRMLHKKDRAFSAILYLIFFYQPRLRLARV